MDAQDIFDFIIRIGLHPNVIMFTCLIHGYCCVNKMDEVMKIFHAMMSAGLQPNVVVYGTLVNSYCKTGRIDDALNLP
jgi:pentatricopeptide repeat protein